MSARFIILQLFPFQKAVSTKLFFCSEATRL